MSESANHPEQSATPPDTDEQLMVAFGRGSAKAFQELFQRYRQPLFGFFRRRVGDREAAEELAQETFLAVLRASGRYRPDALFRTYLYAIGYKILRGYRRKAAFRAAFFGMRKSEPVAADSGDAAMLLRESLGKLERIDREILLLREFEELSYAEIAEVLRLPLNTVRSRLFRARTALRELLMSPVRKQGANDLAELEERA
jgi:RNA polymerase sigma-70 factor (ECF subfamily)